MLESLEIFTLAESLGGVESLAASPAEMTHASVPGSRAVSASPTGSSALSVGLEDVDDLWEDLRQALAQIPAAVA